MERVVNNNIFNEVRAKFDHSKGGRQNNGRRSTNPSLRSTLPRQIDEVVVLEITQDGGRNYLNLTVRQLYNHVLKAITKLPITSQSYSMDVIPLGESRQRRASFDASLLANDTLSKARIEEFEQSQNTLQPPQRIVARNRTVSGNVTYRERLGAHLHPRDMRRLVTPFSISNEPELIVRRHVMLLNFDPLRAVILRDRLLVLVPDGADSLLENIESRVRAGAAGVENDIFGESQETRYVDSEVDPADNHPLLPTTELDASGGDVLPHGNDGPRTNDQLDDDEMNELAGRVNLPFELQCLDAILLGVTELLANEADELQDETISSIEHLVRVETAEGTFAQEMLRTSKNNVRKMVSRVNGFNRAMTQVLNEDEDMALMNLSRLITHPERFIQPVSAQVLEEESDEPELILEAYLQIAVTLTNELESLDVELRTTEGLINMKSDTLRNRILFVNLLSAVLIAIMTIDLCFVGFFSTNVPTKLYDGPPGPVFKKVVYSLVFGSVALVIIVLLLLRRAGIRTTAV